MKQYALPLDIADSLSMSIISYCVEVDGNIPLHEALVMVHLAALQETILKAMD